MFEVAFTFSTQRSKEAWDVANAFRVGFIVLGTVEMFLIQFFDSNTIASIFDIMFAVAFITVAGA
jgi:hypothetical protein